MAHDHTMLSSRFSSWQLYMSKIIHNTRRVKGVMHSPADNTNGIPARDGTAAEADRSIRYFLAGPESSDEAASNEEWVPVYTQVIENILRPNQSQGTKPSRII